MQTVPCLECQLFKLGQVNNHMMKNHCAQCNNSVVDWETPLFQLYHILNVSYYECTMFGMSAVQTRTDEQIV